MKKQITDKINQLKKIGMNVITFQTDKRKRRSEKNMTDYFIYGKGWVIFIECKIGKDKLSEGQENLKTELSYAQCYNDRLIYAIITETNYINLVNELISRINGQGIKGKDI